MKLKQRLLSFFVTIVMALTLLPQVAFPAFASQTDTPSDFTGTVYISYSHDGQFATDKNGNYMAYVPVNLATLAAYDYGNAISGFDYDANNDGTNELTVLKLFYYMLAEYGQGTDDFTVSGSPGSAYMESGTWHFANGSAWDQNQTYYYNGMYPLMAEETGATCDQITLHNGDFIDVGHYSDWNFYFAEDAGFQYFAGDAFQKDYAANTVKSATIDGAPGYAVHSFTGTTGEPVKVSLIKAWGSVMSGASTGYNLFSGSDIYYGTSLYDTNAKKVSMGTNAASDPSYAEITFTEPGTYYLWSYGTEEDGAVVNTGTYATVTVTGNAIVQNHAPALAEGVSATAEATVTTGSAYSLDLATIFADEDGDALSYTVKIGDADAVAADANYSFTPAEAGSYTLVFKANDGTADSEDAYTVSLTAEAPAGTDPTTFWDSDKDGTGWYAWNTNYSYIKTVTVSGASVESYTWDGNTCNVVLVPKTKKDASFAFATTSYARTSSGGANINGTKYSGSSASTTIELDDAAASVTVQPYYSSRTGTVKTFNFSIKGGGVDSYYNVTLPEGEGFTAQPVGESASPVLSKGDYSFKVDLANGFKKGADFAVKVNGTVVEPDEQGVYTISKIKEDKTVTVEDVVTEDTVLKFRITLPEVGGVTVAPTEGYSSPVVQGNDYKFTVTLATGYLKTEQFAVKANDAELTPDESGVYTIENVQTHQTVTVTGVVQTASVTAPKGCVISAGILNGSFKYTWADPAETVENEDGTFTAYFLPLSGTTFYRVQSKDYPTYWDFQAMTSGKAYTVKESDLSKDDETFGKNSVYRDFKYNNLDLGDVYLNINQQGYLPMEQGATRELDAYRNWQAIEGISNARIAVPDFHYEVIDVNGNPSDLVTITPDVHNSGLAIIKASENATGLAIVKVSYDAMTHAQGYGSGADKTRFSAIWPECTGVFLVGVGEPDGSGINLGMTINVGTHAGKVAGDNIDAEHDLLYYVDEEGASYTFTPAEGSTVTIARSTLADGTLTYNGFTNEGVSTADDGKVTVTGLTAGRHIVKVEKDGAANYQILTARHVDMTVKDGEGNEVDADHKFAPGETVTVTLRNVNSPQEKLATCYNNNFSVVYYAENDPSTKLKDSGAPTSGYGVYNFSSTVHGFTFTIPEDWEGSTFSLINGSIAMGGFSGCAAGGHRGKVSYNTSSGMATGTSGTGVLGQMPVLTFKVAKPPVELSITNNTGMFKLVSASIEFEENAKTLVFALSGTGYKYLFKGTYEDAVANGDKIENWIPSTENAAGKLEFRVPLDKNETYIPIVAISDSYYQKYLKGQNPIERAFYPRQVEIDESAKTLVSGDYSQTFALTVTNGVAGFTVDSASMNVTGGPNSNNYQINGYVKPEGTKYDAAFIGYAEDAAAAEETDLIKTDEDGQFAIEKLEYIVTAGNPDSIVSKLEQPIVVSFRSAADGIWNEKVLTFSRTNKTMLVKSLKGLMEQLKKDKEDAEAAKEKAEKEAEEAKAAQKTAEEAKATAEAAQKAAEEAKATAEAGQKAAEEAKATAEAAQKAAEEAKATAEAAQKAAEEAKDTAEAEAKQAKADKAAAEAEAKQAKADKAAAEAEAKQAKADKETAEAEAKQAKADKAAAEAEAKQAKADKETAEAAKAEAEAEAKLAKAAQAEAEAAQLEAEAAARQAKTDKEKAEAAQKAAEAEAAKARAEAAQAKAEAAKAKAEAIANAAAARVKIKSVKAGKKSLKVKWAKVKGANGYEVQVATNKKFTKNVKTITVSKGNATKAKIKKLLANKKYFVRVRAYKNVKGGTVYGKWSKTWKKKTK